MAQSHVAKCAKTICHWIFNSTFS